MSTHKTRLLLAAGIFPPEIGGPAVYAKLLVDELPAKGIYITTLPFHRFRSYPKFFRHISYAVSLAFKARHADVIYALDPVSVGLPSLIVAKLMAKPLAVRIAGDYAWEQGVQRAGVRELLDEFLTHTGVYPTYIHILKKIQTLVARHSDCVIVPSDYLRHVIMKWGIPSKHIHVIHNSFEAPKNLPSKTIARAELGLSVSSGEVQGPILVTIGRLVPWKGFSALIECVPALLKEHKGLVLHVIGDGPDMEKLKTLVHRLKLQQSVIFHGNLVHEKVIEYIRAADVYVLNTAYEGLSHQLLEAMACETPIVTTSIGANNAVVRSGKEALLVAYNDRPHLTKAIHTLLRNPHYALELARHAHARITRYTTEKMISHTASILHIR